MRGYWHRLLDATSQWLNVALLNGEANHSISGDTYRFGRWRMTYVIDKVLGKNHCKESHLNDVERARALLAEHEPIS